MTDRSCERCTQAALTHFQRGKSELAFCGHHTNSLIHTLMTDGWRITVDNREWKVEEPKWDVPSTPQYHPEDIPPEGGGGSAGVPVS